MRRAGIAATLAIVATALAPTANPAAGDGAAGYAYDFAAQVNNGSPFGQYKSAKTAAEMTLRGAIGAGGDAQLIADGKTGMREYSVGRLQPASPYHYTVTAHFDARSESGRRNELRPCALIFSRR